MHEYKHVLRCICVCVRTIAKTCVDVSQEQMPKAYFVEEYSVWYHGICACFACLTISLYVRPYVHMYVYVHVFTGGGLPHSQVITQSRLR